MINDDPTRSRLLMPVKFDNWSDAEIIIPDASVCSKTYSSVIEALLTTFLWLVALLDIEF